MKNRVAPGCFNLGAAGYSAAVIDLPNDALQLAGQHLLQQRPHKSEYLQDHQVGNGQALTQAEAGPRERAAGANHAAGHPA
ncbi:hypothetical protein J2W30_006791 [Variovorax boronicumulans]|uniref:hypothetical protein n=1 Tax=Variovorax boronicumulans TaxID=436515 RepID=UPI002786EE58|nr:hypothetical protein [Variovorax boronicumulans]MDP9993954.1 hypothetical protein [Variovorax boronicumulans]MDQ0005183.1 hypothetical protein [Variovorax boronicumulans]MDQ0038998.1 hypothetical protein [Variovorax boronicumulans]